MSTAGRRLAAVTIPPRSKRKFGLRADARQTGGADPVLMRATQSSPSIAVEGLTKRYGDVTAVDDLSFTVRPGAVTGFLGPNGAGKTTALKAIVALARPTRGAR
jgi:ABC-type glutathione transport system ATPase component